MGIGAARPLTVGADESVVRLPQRPRGLGKLVGDSPVMRQLFTQIRRVAPTDVNVLITGESGTGKELVAETIHSLSGRASEPFVAVNCGAIPASLVEAELFGYERGSFTGAVRSQAGYFERAGAGTIFLDETAEMPVDMQVKLLRALEARKICRVGGDHEIPLEARVIGATNRLLSEAVNNQRLRADLLYRLAVFYIDLPALRERGEDVELLADHFLERLNTSANASRYLSAESRAFLHQYTWPGNVRELFNTVQRAFIMSNDELDLAAAMAAGPRLDSPPVSTDKRMYFRPGMSLAELERIAITETLRSCKGNKTRAARCSASASRRSTTSSTSITPSILEPAHHRFDHRAPISRLRLAEEPHRRIPR